jgi:hypothetical protein
MSAASGARTPWVRLALLSVAAIAIHGYHLGVEDGEIFIPAARKLLHPQLYPFATEFFQSHEHLSLFSPILAGTARFLHLSMDWTVFLWYLVSLYTLLTACWMLASVCFVSQRARWCSMLVLTAVLTMPATNTGLLLIDPYLTPRSFSTPLTLIALVCFLRRQYVLAALTTAFTATIHPQMAAYLVFLAATMLVIEKCKPAQRERVPVLAGMTGILPASFHFGPAEDPYREALYARDFYFLSNWTWYHWLGMLAPLAILAWFWKGKIRATTPEFKRLSFALIPFGLLSILVAALFSSSHSMDMFARLQPLRCFHLITFVFMLLLGGVLGEYAARNRSWALAAIFLPLAIFMGYVARETYPASAVIDWPGLKSSSNPWVNTMLWVRKNTPEDAVFAVDSHYFLADGIDAHGFRALSERAALADYYKDGGVVSIFPQLAPEWKQMSSATDGLNRFSKEDFTRLARQYPVTWTVIHGSAPEGMNCPYDRQGYAVCRIAGDSVQPQAFTSRRGQ